MTRQHNFQDAVTSTQAINAKRAQVSDTFAQAQRRLTMDGRYWLL